MTTNITTIIITNYKKYFFVIYNNAVDLYIELMDSALYIYIHLITKTAMQLCVLYRCVFSDILFK